MVGVLRVKRKIIFFFLKFNIFGVIIKLDQWKVTQKSKKKKMNIIYIIINRYDDILNIVPFIAIPSPAPPALTILRFAEQGGCFTRGKKN